MQVKRDIRPGGLSSVALFAGCCGVFAYGMYKVVMHNRDRRAWRREEEDVQVEVDASELQQQLEPDHVRLRDVHVHLEMSASTS